MPINLLDGILIGLILALGAIAMIRGVSRELLSLASLVAAIAAALFLHDKVSPLLAPVAASDAPCSGTASIAAAGLLFIAVLLLASLFSVRINNLFSGPMPGRADRVYGFALGALRGLMIATAGVLFYNIVYPVNQPAWFTNSRSKPMLEAFGSALEELFAGPAGQFLIEKSAPLTGTSSECWVKLLPASRVRENRA